MKLCNFFLASGLSLVSALSANAADTSDDLASLRHEVQRTRDWQQIQNLMSRRAYYHSIGRNDLELTLWATKHPIRWAQNQGCWVGVESYRKYYVTINNEMRKADLKRLAAANPAIKDIPESLGVGNNAIHTLTTPIIEIAGDGETAKGTWYTPGVILTTQDGKTPKAMWIWEHYGADFIREDGQWRIWHVQVNTDFMNPVGEPFHAQPEDAAAMGKEGGKSPAPGPGAEGLKIPGPDLPKWLYREFGPTRVPTITPALPVPYETIKDTFEYADCNSTK